MMRRLTLFVFAAFAGEAKRTSAQSDGCTVTLLHSGQYCYYGVNIGRYATLQHCADATLSSAS